MTPLAVTFTTPLALLALLLIPLLAAAIWWRGKRPRRDVVRFPGGVDAGRRRPPTSRAGPSLHPARAAGVWPSWR